MTFKPRHVVTTRIIEIVPMIIMIFSVSKFLSKWSPYGKDDYYQCDLLQYHEIVRSMKFWQNLNIL